MSKYRIIRDIKIIMYIIRKAKLFTVFVFLFTLHFQLSAQGKLGQRINMPRFEQASIRQIFGVLKEQGFAFSYNSRLFQIDSLVSTTPFDGLCIDYLEKMLGPNYGFKETSSHIIITYAPQRMDVDVNMNVHETRAVISGYVRDLRTEKAIADASIYDKYAFNTSTLSDKNGYFLLDIKKPGHTVAIVWSKANYKDTSMMMLLPIEALKLAEKKKTGFYSMHDSKKSIFNSFFGRLFTGSSQRVQSVNLGGFFAYSPFQLSLTPGLSTHGSLESQVVNNFSLNIIGGSTAGVDGTELGGVFNVNQYDMQGMQVAGVLNVVGGNVHGLQMSGGGNVILHNFSGTQLGGIWNTADTLKKGFQAVGVVNRVNESNGTQIAGAMNISRGYAGSQIAGGINIANKVKGIQLAGLLNIADSSDYPIAVLNLIKKGHKQLSFQIDDSHFLSTQFRSGGRVLYSLIGIGAYVSQPDMRYATEFGLGAQLLNRRKFGLATELVQRMNFDDRMHMQDAQRFSLRIIPSWKMTKHWHIYAAPSFIYSEATASKTVSGVQWKAWESDRFKNTFHAGGSIGLSYVF